MCGFAGIVTWDQRYAITRPMLAALSAPIAHRGPDGEGRWLSHENAIDREHPQVGLVHRRLAILDLDPRANQPLTDGQNRWVAFNGEIYNFRALRDRLRFLRPDYRWKTECDTEVLLVAYDVWGARCVDELNGMFAFAIWDGPNHRLVLGRDRMGQKPLYVAYLQSDGSWTRSLAADTHPGPPAAVAFASELEALLTIPWVGRSVDADAIVQYLQWSYIPAPATAWRSCIKLPPATLATITAIGASARKYFAADIATDVASAEGISDSDAVQQTRSLVERAVQRQLVSDVPVGCFLSGGVDSSIIASAMARALPAGTVRTFSIGFEDPKYDETQAAELVAKHLGTQHLSFKVKSDAMRDLPRLAAVYGEPFGDSSALPTHYLSREVRQHVKVALSGDGGDELFGGYDRYRALILSERLRKTPRALRSGLEKLLPGSHPKGRLARLKRLLGSVDEPIARRYASYLRLFSDDAIRQLLAPDFAPLPRADDLEARMQRLLASHPAVVSALAADRGFYLPEDLLTKLDRASMLHALEVRSPFMDHDLVTFATRLSTDQLLKGGPKRLLREAFSADFPSWVFRRAKMGFAVPIGQWFRGELRDMLRDHLFASDSFASAHFNRNAIEMLIAEHEQKRADHSQRLYALLMLELWWARNRPR